MENQKINECCGKMTEHPEHEKCNNCDEIWCCYNSDKQPVYCPSCNRESACKDCSSEWTECPDGTLICPECFEEDFQSPMREKEGKCCLCKGFYIFYGNDAFPLANGICCNDCNDKVINARLAVVSKRK